LPAVHSLAALRQSSYMIAVAAADAISTAAIALRHDQVDLAAAIWLEEIFDLVETIDPVAAIFAPAGDLTIRCRVAVAIVPMAKAVRAPEVTGVEFVPIALAAVEIGRTGKAAIVLMERAAIDLTAKVVTVQTARVVIALMARAAIVQTIAPTTDPTVPTMVAVRIAITTL
jgi:hypothetical protein